jgi:hypothetical protein
MVVSPAQQMKLLFSLWFETVELHLRGSTVAAHELSRRLTGRLREGRAEGAGRLETDHERNRCERGRQHDLLNTAPVFPGTAFSDPEFAAVNPRPMGISAQLFIGFVLIAILLAAVRLLKRG